MLPHAAQKLCCPMSSTPYGTRCATNAYVSLMVRFPCRFATPMRTPRAASARGEDRLVAEAQNLARLQQGQTPLFGGDSGVHIEKGDFGDSLDPRAGQSVRATPSALTGMTPAGGQTGMRSIAGVPGTPSVAGTPLRTPGQHSHPFCLCPLSDPAGCTVDHEPDLYI